MRDWRVVQHFTFDRRHFLVENLNKGTTIQCLYNDGRTIVIFDGKGKRFCSNFGDDHRLLQYDLRPQKVYSIVDGVLRKHRRGTETISGYYPSYVHDQSGRQVWIGPKLRFYFEPQEPIEIIALRGDLLVPLYEAKLCENCNGPLPMDSGPNAKYCSSECGLLTVEDRERLAREARNARMMTKKLREMSAAPPRSCLTCEGDIDFKLCGPAAKYCCDECKPRKPSSQPCATCGGPVDRSKNGRNAKYCSYECGFRTTEQLAAEREAKRMIKRHAKLMKAVKVLKDLE